MKLKFPRLKLSDRTAAMMVSGTVSLAQKDPLTDQPVTVYLTPAQLRELADWAEAQKEA